MKSYSGKLHAIIILTEVIAGRVKDDKHVVICRGMTEKSEDGLDGRNMMLKKII